MARIDAATRGIAGGRESPLRFPCDLPIKVLGANSVEFRAAAVAIVRAHCPGTDEHLVAERSSRDGRYLSLTITARVETREQADAVYGALTAHDQVLIVL